jgi:predicted patatin/cPLA2 family phospholipase
METPTQATNEDEIYQELKEIVHYLGGRPDGFNKIREIIDTLEDNENEAAWERHVNRY